MQESRLHLVDKLGQYLLFFEHLSLTDWSCSEAKHWRKYSNMKFIDWSAKKGNDRITFLVPTRLCIKQKGRRKGGIYRVYFTVFCFIYLFIYLFIHLFVCLFVVQGWCGWKGPDFWNQQVHYNMCMPQRPDMI